MLGLAIYGLALPFLMPLINRLLPAALTTCPSMSIFHRPCPLCGLTRSLAELAEGHLAEACSLNILCLPMAILLLVELAWRTAALRISAKRQIPERIIKLDLWSHSILLAGYMMYGVVFVIRGL